MTSHQHGDVPGTRPAGHSQGEPSGEPFDGDLQHRIQRLLQARATLAPDAATVSRQLRGAVREQQQRSRRRIRTGVVAGGLVLAGLGGGGVAAAVAPEAMNGVVKTVSNAVGVDWSLMPDGYTKEQYQAFWGAGYSAADVETLNTLWHTDSTRTKARAGQLILDHQKLPITPHPEPPSAPEPAAPPAGATPPSAYTSQQYDAFWGAGYTAEDVTALNSLWHTDSITTKARAGQLILDHHRVPVAPHGKPGVSTTASASPSASAAGTP